MTLVERRAAEAWGEFRIIETEPTVEEHRNVYATPLVYDARWGVFDTWDQSVEATVDRGWPDARPNRCIPESPTTYVAVNDRLPDDVEYVYGGVYQPHFGHFLLETLSRLWPLAEGLRRDQRLLMHGPADPANWWMQGYVRATLGALGITPDQIVHVAAPLRVTRLLVPAQSFRVNAYAYPAYAKLCHRIGEALLGCETPPVNVRPVFLSKARLTSGVTGIVNEQDLIDELERHGVEIVFPEQLNFKEKIDLYRRRKIVGGWATSGQHVSIFAPTSSRMEMLTGGLALNSNCIMIDRLNSNDARYWDAELEDISCEGSQFLSLWRFKNPGQTARQFLKIL